MKCSRCDIVVPRGRIDMGYTICIECSTEEKVSCHTIYPHKTGGYIQVVSKEQSERMNKLDRRGSSAKSSKHYKEFVVKKKEPVKVRVSRCTKVYTTYDTALKQVLNYYDEWGYQPTLTYIRLMNSSGDIPLMTRVKIQNVITDKYLEPSPRTLIRKFNKQI
jgi:hypothetical protein